jgi:hypothetical protein
MKALDAFLASDDINHPKFGNRYELLYKLANPDVARVGAIREMNKAGQSRLTTGRSGRQCQPNIEQQILSAKTNADAFELAAKAAMQSLGLNG